MADELVGRAADLRRGEIPVLEYEIGADHGGQPQGQRDVHTREYGDQHAAERKRHQNVEIHRSAPLVAVPRRPTRERGSDSVRPFGSRSASSAPIAVRISSAT